MEIVIYWLKGEGWQLRTSDHPAQTRNQVDSAKGQEDCTEIFVAEVKEHLSCGINPPPNNWVQREVKS